MFITKELAEKFVKEHCLQKGERIVKIDDCGDIDVTIGRSNLLGSCPYRMLICDYEFLVTKGIWGVGNGEFFEFMAENVEDKQAYLNGYINYYDKKLTAELNKCDEIINNETNKKADLKIIYEATVQRAKELLSASQPGE